jgi:hypothetical protein
MQRFLMQRYDDNSEANNEISILALFERFAFAILPCELQVARDVIRSQGDLWNKNFVFDEPGCRDVRMIYDSPDGPNRPPAIQIGILLSEVHGSQGKRTLFVSSVADGYSSMVITISKMIPGTHLLIEVSRQDLAYPRSAVRAAEAAESVRTVYAMRDSDAWVFYEKGDPLPFEEIGLYQARRKRDRLTPEIIAMYLERIGYGSLRRDFWIDEASPAHVLATQNFRPWRPDQAMSDG